jgi:hypothetical protein
MDKIEELYNLYLENNIISDAVGIDVFRAASLEQREQLYNLGVQKGVFETTTLSDFNRPWFEAEGGAEKFIDVAESVKKKDTGVLEQPSDPGFSALSDLTDEQFQERARQEQEKLIPPTEVDRITALEREAEQYPTISKKRGEIQRQVDEIRSQYQPQPEDVTDKTNYKIIKESLAGIDSQIEEITNQYEAVASQQESDPLKAYNLKNQLIESDGNLQYLKRQKELYEQDNARYDKAIEELSKDTGGNVGIGNLLKSISGVFYAGDEAPSEIVEYTEEFKERLVRSLGDEMELERLIGGRMSLEKKEQIIFRAKIDFIQEKQREAQQIISDPNATKEEKQKAIDKLSLSYFDAGYDVFNNRFKNMFKSSEEARNFKELATKINIPFIEELADTLGTFGQAVYETAAGYFIQAPAEIMAEGYNVLYRLFGGKDKYTSADKFIDSLERFTTFQVLPSSEEQGLLLNENGEFDFSLYGATKGVAETLPFTLSILAAMRSGKFKLPDNSNMVTRLFNSRKNPKKAYETYKLITTSYRTALSQSMRDAREQGLSGTEAAVYGNAHALMEGITNTIMPDTKYFRTEAGRVVLRTFLGNLKNAANKQARGQAVKDFITTITKEIGEEEAMALYEDIAKAYTFTDSKLFEEFTDINRQKQLLTVTVGLSGGLGAVRVPSNIRQARADIYNDIAKSADQLMAMVDDEIATYPERAEELGGVKTYINDVARAVETSPQNVTFEEIDLLTQKLNLQREMESVDEAFRGPYKEKINALNERIAEAAKSYTVDITEDEARQALEDEGVTNPTMAEVIKKQNELIKREEDAVQEQETRDIPDAQPTEAVQEVEAEVREPAVQEEEKINDSQIPVNVELYTYEGARVRVVTNLDGSRQIQWIDKNNRPIGPADNVSKNNTQSTTEIMADTYGNYWYQGKVESMATDQVINPKIADKMSPRQKKDAGIEDGPVVQEQKVESPIQQNLNQGESVVQTEEDKKGRVFTYTKQESKKDGVKKTKFFFNRSDKAADQRNSAPVDEDVALADTKYEIDPADKAVFEENVEEGTTVRYKVSEIREGKSGAAATVMVETTLPDGTVTKQKAEVQLITKAEQETKTQDDAGTTIKVKPGNRLFNEPLKAVKKIADGYYKRVFKSERPVFEGTRELDTKLSKRISDAFEAMEYSPNDPNVKAAYEALAKETIDQYKAFIDAGYSVEIDNVDAYANSQEMIDDLRNNKTIKIFSTEAGFGKDPITDKQRKENPLLRDSGFKDMNGQKMLINDVFRAIHDFYGHAELGNGFGAKGEENAWNVHSRMFSPLARRAMTTETRGQNSYVNFSGVNEKVETLRDKARSLRDQGKESEAQKIVDQIYELTQFANQKIGLLPEEFSKTDEGLSASKQKEAATVSKQEIEQQVQDLETKLKENNPQFQLATSMTSEQNKQALVEEATKQMEEAEQVVADEAVDTDVVSPQAKIYTIEVKENSALANKVRRMGLSELIGKKINLVMADQLKVSDKYMGGPFFPLMEKLFGKIAWASMDEKAATRIVNGAIKSDYSVVFNMNPTAVLSNKAFRDNIIDNLSEAEQSELFNLLSDYISQSKKSKWKGAIASSKTLPEFFENIGKWGTAEKIDLFNAVIPTEKVTPKTGVGEFLKDRGLTMEKLTTDVSEQFVVDLPAGAMTMVLQVTDKKGNPVTKETANEAILTREQQEDEGLPTHPNYPVYIRGNVVGILNETVPFWEATKNIFDTINKKIAGIIRKNASEGTTRKFSAKEAYNDAYYQAMLSANKSVLVVDPSVSEYSKFVSLLSTAIPSVEVVTTQERFDELSSDIYAKKLSTKNQKIYGAIYKGKLYLNPALENYNTPVHEFGHIWTNVVKETNRALYDKGISLIEQSEYVAQIEESAEYQKVVKQMIRDGATEAQIREYIREEALATAIGDKGEAFVTAAQKRGFKTWLTDLFNFIKKLTGISKYSAKQLEDITLDKFLEGVVVDLMSGTPLFNKAQVENMGAALQLMTGRPATNIDMYSTVQYARQNGFNDEAIKEYLRRQGFKVAEINQAMEVPFEIGTNVPLEFGNVEGGMLEGMKAYKNVLDKLKAWKKRNRAATFEQSREKGIELLSQEEVFKSASDSIQKELTLAFNKNFGVTKNKQVAQEMKRFREILRDRKRVQKELNRIKTDLRIFVRKTMPQALWENKEVSGLMTAISNATPKNIQLVYQDVSNIITQRAVKDLFSSINKFKNVKTTSLQSGRVKGKMLVESQERIDKIKSDISLDNKSSVEDIQKKISELQTEFGSLMMKDNPSEKDLNRVSDVQMAIQYNEALLMEDTAQVKADSLTDVAESLKQVVAGERTVYKEAMAAATKRYNELKNNFFEAVAGFKVDFNDPVSVNEAKQRIKRKQNLRDNRTRARRVITDVFGKIDSLFIRTEGVEGLLNRISKEYTQMFGGTTSEMIADRLDESTNTYKLGVTQVISELEERAKEIYGKNYKKLTKQNTVANVRISTISPSKVAELNKRLKSAATKEERNKISREIDELTELMSQNQMYYLYNQYKDPANHPGFETKFGENYAEVMREIEEKLDPKVKEWADWQVDEFFPSIYERYNTTYKDIYKANMPWNSKYAGRIVREGAAEEDPIDMMDMSSNDFRTAVGSASSKVRIRNSKSIQTVDGDTMLSRYVDDMEYFRAYAENMRDITKFYRNPLIKEAIIATTGQDVYNILDDKFNKVLNRKLAASSANTKFLQFFTRGYVLSKLGLNPTIFLKQMTSALAFADYIGYRNWVKYATSELANGVGAWNTTWKELYKNSVYLQERYSAKDFSKIIESYNKNTLGEVSGGRNTDKVVDFFMYLVKQGDKGGIMGAIPNYAYYKEQFKGNNPKATEQQAVSYAVNKVEREIKTTQQSQDIQDRDFFQTDNVFYRWLSLFTSSPRALVRKEIYSVRNLYRKMVGAPSAGTTKENVRTFFTYHVAIPMFFQYIALGLPGLLRPWRDDDDEELGMAAVLGNLNSLFIFGDIIAAVRDYTLDKPWAGDMRSIPFFSSVTDVFDNLKKMNKTKDQAKQDKYFKDFVLSIIESTGIPAGQAFKWADNLKKLGTMDVDGVGEAMLRLLNYSNYVVDGSKKSAKIYKYKKMPKQK